MPSDENVHKHDDRDIEEAEDEEVGDVVYSDKVEVVQDLEEKNNSSFESALESVGKKQIQTRSVDRAYLARTKEMLKHAKNNRFGSLNIKPYKSHSIQKQSSS